jgi:large subunit ribosomal protein L18
VTNLSKLRNSRERRHLRVRKKISGTSDRPRLCVYRSLNHIYAQVVNDSSGTTLAAASTLEPEVRCQVADKSKVDEAKTIGELLAKRARDRGITKVVFDRGGFMYHGRVKALADAAREAGLAF